jgi:putative hydrolase of HD superfamily
MHRLDSQLAFLHEIDKVKNIFRQTAVSGSERHENDAEHSWHLAVMAMVLSEYAAEPVDLCRVIRMVLVHDLVEIDAGDTFCYDEQGALDKAERENACADRLFAMLPDAQGSEMRALWDEFEARETAEARFACAIDRMQPIFQNYHTHGHSWVEHGIHIDQVLTRNTVVRDTMPAVWEKVLVMLENGVKAGWLQDDR